MLYYEGKLLVKSQTIFYTEMGKKEFAIIKVMANSFLYIAKPTKTVENRYYIENKILIKKMVDTKIVKNSKNFSSELIGIYSELKDVKAQLKKP